MPNNMSESRLTIAHIITGIEAESSVELLQNRRQTHMYSRPFCSVSLSRCLPGRHVVCTRRPCADRSIRTCMTPGRQYVISSLPL